MENCIFCKIVSGEAESWKVYENGNVYAFFDIHPMTRYHTLIIPKLHYTNIFDIPEEELTALIVAVKRVASMYQRKLGMEHVQIISNSGSMAQQTVFHAHFHLIPRHLGNGPSLRWRSHAEWRSEFNEMLKHLSS